jgi:hypothetical protein
MATEADKVNTGALATIVAVGALAMIGIATAVTALVRYEQDAVETNKGGRANLRIIQDLRSEQHQKLIAGPTWVDREARTVSLPIDRAKQVVVAEIAKDPNAATPPEPRDAGAKQVPAETDAGTSAADAGLASEAGGPTENELGERVQQPTGQPAGPGGVVVAPTEHAAESSPSGAQQRTGSQPSREPAKPEAEHAP